MHTTDRVESKDGSGTRSDEANVEFYAQAPLVRQYANRSLRPVEALTMLRHHEQLSGRVLEAGCGAGRVIGYLTMTAADAHGIDISPGMIEYCREAYPEGHFQVGDARAVDRLDAAPFDAVLAMFNMLDALDDADRNAALASMFRALVPGGLLFMSSHNRAYAPQVVGPVAEVAGFVRNRDPKRLLRTVPRLPKQVRNHRRVRRFAIDRPEYALLNDPAHDYSLLHYYMWREDQEKQLAAHGFEVLECLDLEGNVLPPGERAEHCSELHYVARRPA